MAWELELKEVPEYNTDTEMKNMKRLIEKIEWEWLNTLSGVQNEEIEWDSGHVQSNNGLEFSRIDDK